jgi:hypothetical protein
LTNLASGPFFAALYVPEDGPCAAVGRD